jgi:hypothetical protein
VQAADSWSSPASGTLSMRDIEPNGQITFKKKAGDFVARLLQTKFPI